MERTARITLCDLVCVWLGDRARVPVRPQPAPLTSHSPAAARNRASLQHDLLIHHIQQALILLRGPDIQRNVITIFKTILSEQPKEGRRIQQPKMQSLTEPNTLHPSRQKTIIP